LFADRCGKWRKFFPMLSATLQFLENDLIRLPKELAGSGLVDFLCGLYDQFQLAIISFDDAVGDEIRLKRVPISILCESIIAAVSTVHQEGMDSAVAGITPGLEAVRSDLLTVARQNEETVLRGQSLYRVRDSKGLRLSQPVELFHLPFELRHLAPAVRYSVGGTPCLYLANSIYTCWTECRLPAVSECARDLLESVYSSRLEFARPALLLDFCYPPWALLEALDNLENPPVPELAGVSKMNSPIGPDPVTRVRYLASWLAIWPLLAAVSLRTPPDDTTDTEKPEYLVPQMLMVWVQRSLSFDGIRYFSTRERPGNNDNDYAIDYAFPVKIFRPSGHCPALSRLFSCTVPVSFGRVSASNISKLLSDRDFTRAESKSRRYMIVDQNGMWHYYGTTYCDMEYVLDFLSPQSLAAAAGMA
jgi:hypothetical protein